MMFYIVHVDVVICMKLKVFYDAKLCGFPIVYICLDTRNIFGSTIIKLALPYFVAHYAFGSVESGLKQCAVLT
jgi:hypothetical protein